MSEFDDMLALSFGIQTCGMVRNHQAVTAYITSESRSKTGNGMVPTGKWKIAGLRMNPNGRNRQKGSGQPPQSLNRLRH